MKSEDVQVDGWYRVVSTDVQVRVIVRARKKSGYFIGEDREGVTHRFRAVDIEPFGDRSEKPRTKWGADGHPWSYRPNRTKLWKWKEPR